MVSWVSLLKGIFSSGLVPMTSRPLVHSPLGGGGAARHRTQRCRVPPEAQGQGKGGRFPATEAACKATESFPVP